MERKLAAILSADVVGYSKLMGIDEEGTLASMKAHRRELADGRIAEHQGRIVKLTGDGILVEFPSVVNALACAVDIQRGMAQRNADVPSNTREFVSFPYSYLRPFFASTTKYCGPLPALPKAVIREKSAISV